MFDIIEVQKIYPEQLKVYGPYSRPDGRKHVVLTGNAGYRRTVSYPKFLKELELLESLDGLTIDHQDRDKTNDSLDNLIIRERSTHISMDAIRAKIPLVICPMCKIEFTPTKDQVKNRNRKDNKAGPFCSRSCAGKYGQAVQNGKIEKLSRTEFTVEYYKIDK